MERSISDILLIEACRLLTPIQELNSPEAITSYVTELGFEFPEGAELAVDLSVLVALVETLVGTVSDLIDGQAEDDATAALSELARQLPDTVKRLQEDVPAICGAIETLPEYFGETEDLAVVLLRRFLDYLVYEYLERYHFQVFALLHVLGMVEISHDAYGLPVRTVQWDRLPKWFSNPLDVVDETYQWKHVFHGDEFLSRILVLLSAFGLPGDIYPQDPGVTEAYGGLSWGGRELRIPLFQVGVWPDDYAELDLVVFPLPASADRNPGLALYPYIYGELDIEHDIDGGWKIRIRGDADLSRGFGVQLLPPHSLSVTKGLFSDDPLETLDARLEVGISKAAAKDKLNIIFGSQDASYLAFREMGLSFLVALEGGKEELAVEFEVVDLTLAVGSSQADGFLQKILSEINISTSCDLVIGFSNLEGVYFRGSSALSIVIPIHEDLGPLSLDTVTIGVGFGEKIKAMLAVSFGFELGPIIGSIDRIGLEIPFNFSSDTSGNYGPIQIDDIAFLPPTALGCGLDTNVIVGGGFLDFDDENKRYSGALALQLGEIGITAIGLITTRMPDGSEGFSMLVNIGITFDPPIQIYMGFTLAGVGGLLGINRTMKTDILREGLKKGTLDSILFPDPAAVIANANQIISDMRAVFPPEEGRFVIGPMVMIGWGPTTIITGEIGIFLELPDPVRIALMGQVEMSLPEPDKTIVSVHIDILGILDLEKKELSFQASIYGSSLGAFELWGDCAFLLSWGGQPEFALAIGGFHPQYRTPPPPAVFADLRRVGVNLNYGPVIQLQCSGYLALTPNSFQFGARVGIFVGLSELDVGISGFVTFDALVIFSPFSFEVGVGGGMTISVMGFTLADIRVSFTLSGPTPWNVRGVGSVNVLGFGVDIGFDFTWGPEDPERLAPVDPWDRLEEALQRAESWGSRLPPTSSRAVALREIKAEPVGQDPPLVPVIIHPAGALEVRQNVVPLDVTLTKCGNAPVAKHDRFRIGEDINGDGEGRFERVDEFFSRGQFEHLSENQKLSVPSFERMQGGVVVRSSSQVAVIGESESTTLSYDTVLIKPDRTSEAAKRPEAAISNWSRARFLQAVSGVHRSALQAQGRARFAHHGEGMVEMIEDKYVIVDAAHLRRIDIDDLDVQIDIPAGDLTRTQADQVLTQHLQLHPDQAGQLMVVAEYELEEAP